MSNPFTYANKVRKKFKDPYWVAKNKYITYYEQLPIDEKVILLESQTATKISGNLDVRCFCPFRAILFLCAYLGGVA